MRQNQLRHEDEIMRLKEQLSDAQRFVLIFYCEFQDIFLLTPPEIIRYGSIAGGGEGRGIPKGKTFKGKYEAKLKFREVLGSQQKQKINLLLISVVAHGTSRNNSLQSQFVAVIREI